VPALIFCTRTAESYVTVMPRGMCIMVISHGSCTFFFYSTGFSYQHECETYITKCHPSGKSV